MKRLFISVAVVSAFLVAGIGTAAAQDQTITADPAAVEAAGETEFTVSGSGFTADPPYAIVPCFAINSPEQLVDLDTETQCDTSQVVLISAAEGGEFAETVTFDVPAEGMCIVAGTLDGAEGGGTCISVGAADGGDDGAAEEEGGEDEELANTGVESGLLAVIAVAVLAAGVMMLTTRRVARS